MAITPIPPYEPTFMPVPNTTPFTYRDGRSYLRKLEDIVKYMNVTVIPFVNEEYAKLAQEFVNQVNILIAVVNQQLALQDAAVTAQLEQQNEDIAEQLNEQNEQIAGQLEDQNALILDQLADQDADVAAQLSAQNTAVTNQLATQNTTVANQLSAQNTAVTNQLSAQNTAVTNQLAAQDADVAADLAAAVALVQTVAFADPVIDAVIDSLTSATRLGLDALYAKKQDTGWTAITAFGFETGWSTAGAGIRGRKINGITFIDVNVSVAAATYTVGVNGAVTGGNIVADDFPLTWCPDFPAPGGGPASRVYLYGGGYTFQLTQDGTLRLASAPIDATQTAGVSNALTTIQVSGSYPASA